MKEPTRPAGLAACIDNRIRRNTIWASLTDEEVDLFNRNVVCREHPPGDVIFLEGAPCKGLYFVEGGLVGIRKTDRDGQSSLVRLASKGDTLGYRPFLAKQHHRAQADVIEHARVCFVDAHTVRTILQNNHQLGLQFLERTAKALGETEERLFEMAVLNVDTRVIHLLVLYRDRWGRRLADGSVRMTLPITRDDFASMIGAHPDSVTRAIRNLESKGLLRVNGRVVRIDQLNLLTERLHTDLSQPH